MKKVNHINRLPILFTSLGIVSLTWICAAQTPKLDNPQAPPPSTTSSLAAPDSTTASAPAPSTTTSTSTPTSAKAMQDAYATVQKYEAHAKAVDTERSSIQSNLNESD